MQREKIKTYENDLMICGTIANLKLSAPVSIEAIRDSGKNNRQTDDTARNNHGQIVFFCEILFSSRQTENMHADRSIICGKWPELFKLLITKKRVPLLFPRRVPRRTLRTKVQEIQEREKGNITAKIISN